MFVNSDELKKALSPIKDYRDLCQRLTRSFSFPFVRHTFNFTLPQLITYTEKLLGGDSRHRYTEYLTNLHKKMTNLYQVGMPDVLSLIDTVVNVEKFESFTQSHKIPPMDVIFLVKYLVYWFIPGEKYLSGLVQSDSEVGQAARVLANAGIRTNLEVLQAGSTSAGRIALTEKSGLSPQLITALVNRADLSRLPWASKATISNIIGAGCASLADLAEADPDQLYANFFNYGKSIGKNLKLGNEIENSHRIAKIVPLLVQPDLQQQ